MDITRPNQWSHCPAYMRGSANMCVMVLLRDPRVSPITCHHTLVWHRACPSDFTASDWVVLEDITTSVDQKIEVMLARCSSIRLLYPNGPTVACMTAMLAAAGGETDALPSRLFSLVNPIMTAVVRMRTAFGSPPQCQAAAALMVYPATPSMLPTDIAAQYAMPAVWPKPLTDHMRFAHCTVHVVVVS